MHINPLCVQAVDRRGRRAKGSPQSSQSNGRISMRVTSKFFVRSGEPWSESKRAAGWPAPVVDLEDLARFDLADGVRT